MVFLLQELDFEDSIKPGEKETLTVCLLGNLIYLISWLMN